MSRRFKKWLKRVLIFAATLVLLLFSVLAWILFDPYGAWDLVGRQLMPKDLQVEWREFKFQPMHVGGWTWEGSLEVQGLSVKKSTPALDLFSERLFFRYTLTFFRPKTHLVVHELDLKPLQGFWQTSSSRRSTEELNPYQWSELIFGRLDLFNEYFSLGFVNVQLGSLELRGSGEPILLSGSMTKAADSGSAPIKIQSRLVRGQLNVSGEFDFLPQMPSAMTPLLAGNLQIKKEAPSSEAVDAKLNLTVQPSTDIVRVFVKGPIQYQTLMIEPTAEVRIHRREWILDLHGQVGGLKEPFQTIRNVKVRLQTPQAKNQWLAQSPSQLEASASLNLLSVKPELRRTLNRLCRCDWPERRDVMAKGKIWLKPLQPSETKRALVLDAAVSAEKTSNALLDLDLSGQLRVFKEQDRFDFVPAVNSSLKIKSFQAAREILQSRGILIPAPLDTLEGTIWIGAESPLKLNPEFSETEVTFKVDVKSEKQVAMLNGHAGLKLKTRQRILDVGVSLDVQKVLLELPPLDPILGIPKLALDSRVQLRPTKPPGKATKSAFRVNLTLAAHTQEPGALRFLSPLADPHLPLTIEAKRTTEGDLIGFLRAEPFKIRYLKRVIYVEQLRVVFDQREDADFSLDGRVRFDATQYKVWADISGTLRNPSIRLRSEPELSRSDIISVLLYDRISDQLVSADRETATSFEAALMDRAIGLFGLWAFASTPIRSFQYNPVTRVYTATVQLAGGVTAGIGTNWESSAQIELRKRVSRQWVLSASWAPGELESQVGKLVLQWERRF